jgi:hypothetical protein
LKILICASQNATVVFCSSCYPGNTSDKEIVQHSGLVDHLEKGDLILADKGFLISDFLPEGVSVNIPPFLSAPQFTPAEIIKTRSILQEQEYISNE